MNIEHNKRRRMSSFLDSALTRKPLQLVRKQAHLGDDDSRYTPVAILSAGDDTSEHSSDSVRAGIPQQEQPGSGEHNPHREAPLRHMSLFDLVAYGIGTTVGSGVFVLAGVAAHSYAGPASSLSYLLSGTVAALSGLPYAELSAAFPVDGSTYSYAYITLGEVFAVCASLCQTLEYGVSAAAVARSWGNKFVDWVKEGHSDNDGGNSLPPGLEKFLEPGYGINPMAAIIAGLCSLILLWGVQESKLMTNIMSTAKVSLVMFMIIAGFLLSSNAFPNTIASFDNYDPFVPPEFGPAGIVDGASILFFAYIGFDSICNLAGEARDPVRDVPRAVVLTITIDGVIYMLASLALTSMLPYDQISTVSAFPRAFGANGWIWAEKLTAIGEIVVLPLVVLASTQAQTRLFFAMSKDGIVPALFGKISFSKRATPSPCCGKEKEDQIGNIKANVQFCGVIVMLLACFLPFSYLDDLISSGVLLLFSITDCCLLTIRYKCPSETFLGSMSDIDENASIFTVAAVRKELSLGRILFLLNIFPFASGLCFAFIPNDAVKYSLTGLFAFLTFCVTVYIHAYCHEISSTRFALERDGYGTPGRRRFRTPLVPYLPALGIYLNWFMLANIGWKGILMLAGYLLVGIFMYGAFCSGKSIVNAPYQEDMNYKSQNILPPSRSTSPPIGNTGLQQALLEDEDWEEHHGENEIARGGNLKKDLSEIETSRGNFV